MNPSEVRLTPDRYDAVLFDLDGVLTATARVHAASWKRMFDSFLVDYAERTGVDQAPFDADRDYKLYVDGKPRYDGVASFLDSRGISLSRGAPDSPADEESVCGLGNRKARMVVEAIERDGVDVYEGSVALLKRVRALGMKTAVVSASKNCRTVLEAAGIADLFDARVDGVVAAERGLRGKPAPDTFVEAAKDLGVEPARAVVVEDALSGVEAGRAGEFGLVVGVDHDGDGSALVAHGADVAVSDLATLLEGTA